MSSMFKTQMHHKEAQVDLADKCVKDVRCLIFCSPYQLQDAATTSIEFTIIYTT